MHGGHMQTEHVPDWLAKGDMFLYRQAEGMTGGTPGDGRGWERQRGDRAAWQFVGGHVEDRAAASSAFVYADASEEELTAAGASH
jgi:8-oxo-dGTP pyrophosphatase MutT (NUDIX family)